MKKLIALVAVCGFAFAMVACGQKAAESTSTVDSAAAPVEQVVDSAATTTDSAATTVDSAAAAPAAH